MALTRKQREILIKNIGFFDGISWVFAIDDRMNQISEAIVCACSDLQKVLDDDNRPASVINCGGEDDAN